MFVFVTAYEKICREKGEAPTSVLVKLGISKSAYTGWQSGGEPSARTKKQLANYFGITIDELEKGVIKTPAFRMKDEHLAVNMELLNLLCQLSPEDEQRVRDFVKGILSTK